LFRGLKLLPYKYIKVIFSIPLFFGYFFTIIRFVVRKYYDYSYAIDYPVNGVESPFGYSPLFYYNYWSVSGFRGHNIKV
jgi:hypothetical protein